MSWIAEHILECARAEQYWVLNPLQNGAWALCRFDDTTGQIGPPVHTSGTLGRNASAAAGWAKKVTQVEGWHPMQSSHVLIEEAYLVVREISRQPRTGRRLVLRVEADPQQRPGVTFAVVRERWDATGLYSDPLSAVSRTEFAGTDDMLRQTAEGFGLDPDAWTTVTEGVEYAHGPL